VISDRLLKELVLQERFFVVVVASRAAAAPARFPAPRGF
jgi:hypothetical protein